jgi:hypothetical protein
MTVSSPTVTAASLRGTLPSASLDARAIVRLAKNPRCQRLAALTLVGSSPGKAMDHVFAAGIPEEQSKFALAKGERFETIQTDNGAARLLASLQDAGVIGPTDVAVRDLKAETSSIGNKKAAMQRAMALTDDMLWRKAAGDPLAPNVVLQAALGVPLGSGELACVRPDILVAQQGEPMYRPGDMKSYPFMHHLTEQRDVGQAAAQIGVYGMALERRLRHLGITHQVPADGVIVMVRPGGLQSVAKLQNIERDISTARRIVDVRPRTLAEVAEAIGPGVALDHQAAILRLRPYYNGKCRAFCALHDVCRGEAAAQGNPAILGEDAEELFSSAGCTIVRAAQLLAGAAPATPDEAALERRMRDLETESRAAS